MVEEEGKEAEKREVEGAARSNQVLRVCYQFL